MTTGAWESVRPYSRPHLLLQPGLSLVSGDREPCQLDAAMCFGRRHYSFPYRGASCVFDHQQRDAEIDAEHVGVEPVCVRLECINKSVAAPDPWAETANHGAEHRGAFGRREWHRTGSRAWHERAVRRAAARNPRPVTIRRIRRSDPPEIGAITRI